MMRRRKLGTVGRVALLWGAILFLAAGIGGWLTPLSVEAASLKSLQSGVATSVPTTGTVVTLSPSIDATKAFVVCSARTTNSNSNRRATCVLTNTTLTIDVGSNSSTTVSVSWYVAEFEGGVTVQRNTASFAGGTATVGVTLSPAVDCTKSFVALAGEQTNAANATNNDEQFTFRAILATTPSGTTPCTSGTSSNLTLNRTVTTNAATVAWQVVTYDGASVQRGTVTIINTATTATATLGTAVDTSKSFILMSRQGQSAIAGREDRYQTRAAFTTTGASVTELTFTRVGSSGTANRGVDISWQVVSLSDGSAVQTGTTTSSGTTATMSTTGLPALDLTRTVTFFTASGGAANTDLDDTSWTVVLTTPSTSTITFTRGISSSVGSSAAWFAVSFNKCGAVSDVTNVSASAQSGQATVYWQPSSTVLIGRKLTTGFGVNDAPVNGKSYLVGEAIGAGTVVDNQAGATSSFSQTGLDASGTTYYFYKVFRKNTTGPCYAPGNEFITQRDVTPMGGAGSPNWSYATSSSGLAPPGLTPNNVVIEGSNDSTVYGMNASNGTQAFTPFDTPGIGIQSRPPVIPSAYSSTGSTIAYVTAQDGKVYAVDNGGVLYSGWTTPVLGGQIQGGAAVWLEVMVGLDFGCTTNPDLAVVGTRNVGAGETTNNTVYGLHGGGGNCAPIQPGGALWTFSPGNMDIIVSTPSIDYGGRTIWVTSYSNSGSQPSLWKLGAETGTLLTSFSFGDIAGSPSGSLDGTLTTPSSFIYVGTNAGELKAVRVSDNTVFTYTPGGIGAIKGAPLSLSFDPPSATTPDTIIFSRDTTVHLVSFDGSNFSPNWTTTLTGTPTVSAPIDDFAETAIYVGASDGKIHSLNPANGLDMAQRTVPSPLTPVVGTPSFDIDLGRVYVGATDGHIYSFDAF